MDDSTRRRVQHFFRLRSSFLGYQWRGLHERTKYPHEVMDMSRSWLSITVAERFANISLVDVHLVFVIFVAVPGVQFHSFRIFLVFESQ